MPKSPKFEEGSFGLEVVMDLYECDPKVVRSAKKLEEYTTKLCKLLKMKKFGKTQLPHFGYNEAHTAGYSMLQFIETSSITGHFSELWNSAYINVFSCRDFDTEKCIDFTVKFFGAKRINKRVLVRK
ncbi:MAG TPA: S-adenosylmethionine decarboxylase [Candidatus Omnitrophica bacterium]|nr:S-adenosylmethionine decarboxylase [Candidatus Omnitrophota bacterium]